MEFGPGRPIETEAAFFILNGLRKRENAAAFKASSCDPKLQQKPERFSFSAPKIAFSSPTQMAANGPISAVSADECALKTKALAGGH